MVNFCVMVVERVYGDDYNVMSHFHQDFSKLQHYGDDAAFCRYIGICEECDVHANDISRNVRLLEDTGGFTCKNTYSVS